MYAVLIVFYLLIKESSLLRMIKVSVPAYRIRGQTAVLECNFELSGDSLYSVKWYRDNEEFYRYMPKIQPPKLAYKVEGIKVDMSKSDARRVVLSPVTLKSRGMYSCEVSAEAPSFTSATLEGRMEVLYLPKEGPRITGNHQENKNGESIVLNCTSGKSYPAATLSWDINGEKVTDKSLLIEYAPTHHTHGLISTALGLQVPPGRSVRVRCTARVTPSWLEGSEASVGSDILADSREALLLVHNKSRRASCSVFLLAFSILLLLTGNPRDVPLPMYR